MKEIVLAPGQNLLAIIRKQEVENFSFTNSILIGTIVAREFEKWKNNDTEVYLVYSSPTLSGLPYERVVLLAKKTIQFVEHNTYVLGDGE